MNFYADRPRRLVKDANTRTHKVALPIRIDPRFVTSGRVLVRVHAVRALNTVERKLTSIVGVRNADFFSLVNPDNFRILSHVRLSSPSGNHRNPKASISS